MKDFAPSSLAATDAGVVAAMRTTGIDAAISDTPAAYTAFIQSELRKWPAAVKQAGEQLD